MKFVTEPSAASGMIRLPLKRRNESSFVMGDHGIKILEKRIIFLNFVTH